MWTYGLLRLHGNEKFILEKLTKVNTFDSIHKQCQHLDYKAIQEYLFYIAEEICLCSRQSGCSTRHFEREHHITVNSVIKKIAESGDVRQIRNDDAYKNLVPIDIKRSLNLAVRCLGCRKRINVR